MRQHVINMEYLKLKMGAQLILLPITHLKIILRLPALHQVPSQTKGFEGILNYHGTSVPVYSLGEWIGLKEINYSLDTPLILCELAENLVGFLVSDVDDVIQVQHDEIQTPDLSHLPAFVKGIYTVKNESMWIIQLADLMDSKADLSRKNDE